MAQSVSDRSSFQLKKKPTFILSAGYPEAQKTYNFTSSFDVPWLIALFPNFATEVLTGSYQLEFR